MIGAVVMTLFRFRIGNDRDSHGLGHMLGGGIERCSLHAIHHDVTNAAELRNCVEVQIQCDAAGRDRRILSQEGGAEQSLLFGRDR